MNNATRKFFSVTTVAVVLGVAVAASPASAVTLYPDGTSGPGQGTLGTVNPGEVNPWHGDWNHGAGYFPGQGGDLYYNEATDGGAWNAGGYYGRYGANVGSGTYASASATLGAVNPGQVNPWHGAWNVGGGQGDGFWGPVDAAGAVAGAVTAPVFGAYNDCQHLQPTYDSFGNYLGQRMVNTCY